MSKNIDQKIKIMKKAMNKQEETEEIQSESESNFAEIEKPVKPKRVLTEKELEARRNALKKAVEVKKELGMINKYEKNKEKEAKAKERKEKVAAIQSQKQITETNNVLPQTPDTESQKERKKKQKIVEKIVYESETESEEEEVIEKVVIMKKPKKKKQDMTNDELIQLTNKELLQQRFYQDTKRRVMGDLFDF